MIGTVDERKRTGIRRMQEFFKQKAREGDAGFAIALTLVAQDHRKRSSPRGRTRSGRMASPPRGAAGDEVHRRAFDLEAGAPGDD